MRKPTGRRGLVPVVGDYGDRIEAIERLVQEVPMIPYRFKADGTDKHLIAVGTYQYRGHYISNAHSEFIYVHLYDKATAPVDGDVPVVTIGVPFESGANQEYSHGVGNDANTDDQEIFGLGIGVAVSLDPDDSSLAVPNDKVVVTILYSEA
jgi:hypothetical protein